jgi:hypothetical protein
MGGHIKDMVSQHWNTPEFIVQAVKETFGGQIDLDPCDNEFSITKPKVSYRLPQHDGLKEPWYSPWHYGVSLENVYCNPPFGRSADGTSIADWVKKAVEAYKAGANVILLIPASTETTFWHEYVWEHYDRICFLRGRVSFSLGGKTSGASTKGTAIVLFSEDEEIIARFDTSFESLGHVVR